MNNALTKTLTAGLMHGIKVYNDNGIGSDLWGELEVISKDSVGVRCGKKKFKKLNISECVPYLKSLNSVHKEIDQLFPENETETYRIESSSSHICITGIDKEDGEEIDLYLWMDEVHNWPFWIIEELIKRHYNVFGLSPEEFIEVNETNNPYR